jgi:choline dehydrogenase-like flavoprotein
VRLATFKMPENMPLLETAVIMQIAEVSDPMVRQDNNWGFQFKWGRAIEKSPKVTIYRNANVRRLYPQQNNRVEVSTLSVNEFNDRAPGHTFYVNAKRVVLAASCIENTRLLLHSGYKQQDLPALGRYLMDHPLMEYAATFDRKDGWNRDDIMRFYGGQTTLPGTTGDVVLMGTLAPTDWARRASRTGNFRARINFGSPPRQPGFINLCWEQLPDAANQVSIDKDKGPFDAVFHDPLPLVQLEMKARDNNTKKDALECLGALLKSEGITDNLIPNEGAPELKGEHAMGTTRMADERSGGVVDADCKMYDAGNLFIAGGSVMPTAGWANPTLTIIALAVRLADHLKSLS